MNDKSIGAFSKATGVALSILLVLYSLSGTFGYLTFGSKVAPDIMLNYEATDLLVVAGIIALIVKMITTYPPILFGGRDTIIRLLLARRKKSTEYMPIDGDASPTSSTESSAATSRCSSRSSTSTTAFCSPTKLYHILITTIWNAVVLLLAIVTPNITVAIGFLGSLASCNVFVYPGMALISLSWRHYQQSKLNYYVEDEHLLCETDGLTLRSPKGDSLSGIFARVNLSKRWVQLFLMLYGVFIVLMGSLMFVIILIQVYRDFQNPIPHGAVCDDLL